MTIHATLHEQDAAAAWATIGLWAVMSVPAALGRCDRAHGSLPPPSNKWT